jgi:hypothetical protein
MLVLDVTARTKDGKEFFNTSKIYMPQSPAYGRGDTMVYGPFRKSGMIADTSLQPGWPTQEKFEILFPFEEKDGRILPESITKEMDVTIQLWYLPSGGNHRDDNATPVGAGKFLFYETTETVTVQ